MTRTKSLKQRIKDIGEVFYGWGTFSIRFQKKIQLSGDDCLGLTDFDKMEIVLDDSAEDKVLRPVLLHEIFHVIFSTMGLRANDEDATIELTTTNEFVVESATRGLLLFQHLNPDLWSVLFDEE